MIESNMKFEFGDQFQAIKFDDTEIYKKFQNNVSNGKGVDFIAYSKDKVILMEIKNCTGHEAENKWRTQHKTQKRPDGTIEDCFDLEVAKKVSCTLSCLTGAGTFDKYNRDDEHEQFLQILNMLIDHKHEIEIILFLEGDFGSQSRSKKMIMESIQTWLKRHFKGWLNCTNCRVIDSSVNNKDVKGILLDDT